LEQWSAANLTLLIRDLSESGFQEQSNALVRQLVWWKPCERGSAQVEHVHERLPLGASIVLNVEPLQGHCQVFGVGRRSTSGEDEHGCSA
jgi:hypothetical protein